MDNQMSQMSDQDLVILFVRANEYSEALNMARVSNLLAETMGLPKMGRSAKTKKEEAAIHAILEDAAAFWFDQVRILWAELSLRGAPPAEFVDPHRALYDWAISRASSAKP